MRTVFCCAPDWRGMFRAECEPGFTVRRIVLTSDLGFSGAGPLIRRTEADLEIVR